MYKFFLYLYYFRERKQDTQTNDRYKGRNYIYAVS